MRGLIAVAVVALALMWCGLAAAQQSADAEAKAQFDTGIRLFDEGKYEQAAVAFARAYELKPTYRLLYNIAQVENELGHYANALEAYTRYLAEGGAEVEKERREQVSAEIKRLRTLVGMIVVQGAPESATVFVDGRRSGNVPLSSPLFVDLGEHEVQVKRGADELHREVVKVAGGQRVTVTIGDAGDAAAAPVGEPARDAAPEGPTPKAKRLWTWVALGVGGAAGVGAIVTGAMASSKAKDVKEQCEGTSCPTEVEGDADTVKALGSATDALIVVAAVGVAAGVVLFFVEPKLSRKGRAVEVAPVAALTGNGGAIVLAGRF